MPGVQHRVGGRSVTAELEQRWCMVEDVLAMHANSLGVAWSYLPNSLGHGPSVWCRIETSCIGRCEMEDAGSRRPRAPHRLDANHWGQFRERGPGKRIGHRAIRRQTTELRRRGRRERHPCWCRRWWQWMDLLRGCTTREQDERNDKPGCVGRPDIGRHLRRLVCGEGLTSCSYQVLSSARHCFPDRQYGNYRLYVRDEEHRLIHQVMQGGVRRQCNLVADARWSCRRQLTSGWCACECTGHKVVVGGVVAQPVKKYQVYHIIFT